MGKATSAPSMAIRRRPIGTPKCRLTAIAEELLADIDKDTVDFVANFDDTTRRADGSADAHSEPAGERLEWYRRGHGDQHPAAQSHRDRRRHHHAGEQSAGRLGRCAEDRARARTSPPAASSTASSGIVDAYTHRPRTLHDARQGRASRTSRKDARPSSSPRFRTR